MRHRFIRTEKANYPVVLLCRCLQVAKSGFYAWQKRGPSKRMQANLALKERIVVIQRSIKPTAVRAYLPSCDSKASRSDKIESLGCSKRQGSAPNQESVLSGPLIHNIRIR